MHRRTLRLVRAGLAAALLVFAGCARDRPQDEGTPAGTTGGATPASSDAVEPQFSIPAEKTHNKFSRTIPPVLRVPSGAVVEVFTKEASDGQFTPASGPEAIATLEFDPIHPLTGPVYVEGAAPGDVLAVDLLEIEIGDWGWAAVVPGFGFLADSFPQPWVRTWRFGENKESVRFTDGVELPLRPFAGVMGVAPDTDSLLVTIPPRANGGNMDNPHLVAGTTVYFPVFVEGALFSVGDTHAVQGDGEISGTAIEAPMRIVYRVRVVKGGRRIQEPQYETDEYYATTGFAPTIDEAARKAANYMIDYLVEEHGLERTEAYVLASLAADFKITETVDIPNMLVAMHVPKSIFRRGGES